MSSPKKPRRMARPLIIGDGDVHQPDVTEATSLTLGAQVEKPASKTSLVLNLLRMESGTTLASIVEATGWLPHTARAALTVLRNKGHAIVRDKVDGVTCYLIASVAAQ